MLTIRDENGQQVASGTAEQCVVQLLRELDTQQLHNIQTIELPRIRQHAVMDERRVPAAVVPAPSAEVGWDHDDEFDGVIPNV